MKIRLNRTKMLDIKIFIGRAWVIFIALFLLARGYLESASNYFRVSASHWALWLSCSFVWRSASNDNSMETGSERQKMQCKKSEAAETRGSDSAFFVRRGVCACAWTTHQCRFSCWSCWHCAPGGSALAALGAPQCRSSRFSTARSYLESASNYYSVIHLYSHGFLIPGEMCID